MKINAAFSVQNQGVQQHPSRTPVIFGNCQWRVCADRRALEVNGVKFGLRHSFNYTMIGCNLYIFFDGAWHEGIWQRFGIIFSGHISMPWRSWSP